MLNKPSIPSPAQRLERKRVPAHQGVISKPAEPAIKLDDGARQMLNAAFDAGMEEIGNEALEQLEYLEPQMSTSSSHLSAEPTIVLDDHTRRMLKQAFDEGMKEIGNNALEQLADIIMPSPEELAGLEINEAVLTAKRAVQKSKNQYLSASEVQKIEAEAPDITIDAPTSKDTYKAMLANVDRHFGNDIHFVHKVSEDKKIIELKDRTKIRVNRANIKCTNPTAKAVEIAIAAAVSSGGTVFAIHANENWIYELAYELAEAYGITLVNKNWDYWCLMRDSEPINPSEAPDIQSSDETIDPPAPRF